MDEKNGFTVTITEREVKFIYNLILHNDLWSKFGETEFKENLKMKLVGGLNYGR